MIKSHDVGTIQYIEWLILIGRVQPSFIAGVRHSQPGVQLSPRLPTRASQRGGVHDDRGGGYHRLIRGGRGVPAEQRHQLIRLESEASNHGVNSGDGAYQPCALRRAPLSAVSQLSVRSYSRSQRGPAKIHWPAVYRPNWHGCMHTHGAIALGSAAARRRQRVSARRGARCLPPVAVACGRP